MDMLSHQENIAILILYALYNMIPKYILKIDRMEISRNIHNCDNTWEMFTHLFNYLADNTQKFSNDIEYVNKISTCDMMDTFMEHDGKRLLNTHPFQLYLVNCWPCCICEIFTE